MNPDPENGLVPTDRIFPSENGIVIYLNVGEQFDSINEKIENAGGKILMPKHDMGEYGYSTYFLDTEGNRIGLAAVK